jgi:DNA mismatch endonuclease (patch repair protein)
MSRIRGIETGIEVKLRKDIWHRGFRYRKNHCIEGIKVDLVFVRYRLAVFVDGCFWHGCPNHYTFPRTRTEFWGEKLRANVDRDRRQTVRLENAGWRVIRIWEHDVKRNFHFVADGIIRSLTEDVQGKTEDDWRVVEVQRTGELSEFLTLENFRDPTSVRIEERGIGAKRAGSPPANDCSDKSC